SEEKNTLQKRYTVSSEAYQLYLQGTFFWKKRNEAGLKSAVKHFEKALEIDLMLNDWDWDGAQREFKLGLKLNPKYATGHHWYAELLLFRGKIEEAFKEISMAVDLDPISQGILKDKGIFQYYMKQYDEAIKTALTTLELDPGFVPVHRLLSLVYTGKGMYEDAIRENKRWGQLTGNTVKTDVALAHILASSGKKDEAKKLIEDTGIENMLSSNDYRGIAIVYAALEEKETTL